MKPKATILISGMIAADPWQGGATWAVLQYVLGLQRLGHDVYFIESIAPKAVRPSCAALLDSENAIYFKRVAMEFGIERRAALLLAGSKETFGLPYEDLARVAARADLLINISGMLTDETLTASIPTRVYLDLDPAFNQLWCAVEGIDMRFDGHTHFVTIGQAIGEPDCPVPTCGLSWMKTVQPIVLERWPVAEDMAREALTMIGNWRAYGSIQHQGVSYGQKAHSFRKFFSLPKTTRESFALALAIHRDETADLASLNENHWTLLDPARVVDTPARYQQFIQQSKAEFGIAKSGYVASRCGWFSDRSLCYLASGRPVIAQETGFSRYLPTGEGLFAFEESQDVCHAVDALRINYSRHSKAARSLAENYFDSDKVLSRLLEMVGA
jgi:hypothetical protein